MSFRNFPVEFHSVDIMPKGKVEEFRYLLSTRLPLACSACTVLWVVCKPFSKKKVLIFRDLIFHPGLQEHLTPFPIFTRREAPGSAWNCLNRITFFPLQEILIANKSPSSMAHDGWTVCNNFTLFPLFPQGLTLHKVTYSYWSLWALNKQNTVDLTSWGVYFQ